MRARIHALVESEPEVVSAAKAANPEITEGEL
jgi:hypothetical protein